MDTTYKTIGILLKKSGIYYDHRSLYVELFSHPDYPSLNAVVDTLSALGIKSIAARITVQELLHNGSPALLYLKDRENRFVLLTSVKNESVEIYDADLDRTETYTLERLEKSWDGVVLYVIGTNLPSGVVNKISRFIDFYSIPICISTLLLFILAILSFSVEINLFYICLVVFKITGIVVCVGMVMHKLEKTNPILDRFCSFSKTTSCSDVLHSEGAKLWGVISLSDIGLIYFSGGIMALLSGLSGFQSEACLKTLFYLSWFCIPYSFYSLYYQYFIVKKWCPLCLSVLVLFGIEFVVSFFYFNLYDYSYTYWQNLIFACITFACVSAVWNLINRLLIIEQNDIPQLIDMMKVKKNTQLFHDLLNESQPIEIDENILDIQGESNRAVMHITAIISPHCSSCAFTFKDLVEIKSKLGDKLNLTILFPLNQKEPEGDYNQASVYFYAIYSMQGWDKFVEALNVWMYNTDLTLIKRNFPIDFNYMEIFNRMTIQNTWMKKVHIHATPTIIVNGRIMPSIYKVKDLLFIASNTKG